MKNISICLSFFDEFDGPKIITILPKNIDGKEIFVSQFFDFHKMGDFFTHIFNEQISFNRLFEIKREESRGSAREFMLTALVSLELLRKRDLLQYYPSIKNLFKNWEISLSSIKNINSFIIDGKELYKFDEIKPIINRLEEFLEELNYLIDIMPEVTTIPINSNLNNK